MSQDREFAERAASVNSASEMRDFILFAIDNIKSRDEFIIFLGKYIDIFCPYLELNNESAEYFLERILNFVQTEAGHREISDINGGSIWRYFTRLLVLSAERDI